MGICVVLLIEGLQGLECSIILVDWVLGCYGYIYIYIYIYMCGSIDRGLIGSTGVATAMWSDDKVRVLFHRLQQLHAPKAGGTSLHTVESVELGCLSIARMHSTPLKH